MARVLIINGFSIGEKNGTGITLENIWNPFKKEELLQLVVAYKTPKFETSITTICTPECFCKIPFTIHKKRNSGEKNENAAVALNGNISQKGFKNVIHDAFRGLLDAWPVSYKCIDDQIKNFKPDVIYTCGASIRILKVANHYSKVFNIPIILHLMDDWPKTIYSTSILSAPFRILIYNYLKKVHSRSKHNLAISEALAEKYKNRYKSYYSMLMNPAMECVSNPFRLRNDHISFIYAGSLSLNRWKSLFEIAQIINNHKNEDFQCSFTIYAPDSYVTNKNIQLFESVGVELHNYIPPEEIRKIYLGSDVMVFTESFDENIKEFISLSLSTKIPDYFSTGHTVLAYLPKGIHSNEYLRKYKAALVANNKEELQEAIQLIASRNEVCYECATNALNKAKKSHSKEAAELILRNAIDSSIKEFLCK